MSVQDQRPASDKRELLATLLRQKLADGASLHPLSHEQRALWFIDQLAPGTPAYNLMRAVRVRPRVDVDTLRAALGAALDRHPCLRTTFVTAGTEPRQLIHDRMIVPLETEDATGWSERELHDHLGQEADRPFDLEKGPLLRGKLFLLPHADDILLLTVHHIASDFWSLEVLLDDLTAIASALRRGAEPALPPARARYTDYVRSKGELLAGPQGELLRAYWHRQLAGELPVLNLMTDRARPAVQTYRGATLPPRGVDPLLASRLRQLAQRESATVYTLMLAVLNVLLHRYTGQDDILVSTPFGARPAGFEEVVGYFVNTLVIRADLAGDPRFASFLDRLQPVVLGAIEHAAYPFPLLVEQLQPVRDSSRSPLAQVGFAWDKAQLAESRARRHDRAATRGGEVALEPVAGEQRGAHFDLALTVMEHGEALSVSWRYNMDLFDAATIGRMAEHFAILLTGIAASPDTRLSDLPLLSAAERRTVAVEWNATATDDSRELCVHHLVERQAAATPDAPAVVAADRQLSYRELDREANRVARLLGRLGAGRGALVGVCVERSPEMVICLLGVLKAGAAYVPFDPTSPRERLDFMIGDAKMKLLLSQEAMLTRLPKDGAQVICLDRDRERIAAESDEALDSAAAPEDLVYVLFTSGSTGRPKGVEIRHRGLVNLIGWHRRAYRVTAADRAAQLAALGFDAAAWELWPYLAVGAAVYLPVEECRASPSQLLGWLAANAITMCVLVSPMAEIVCEHEMPRGLALRVLLTGGDRLRRAPRRQLPFAVFNNYGPTETTVISTWARVAVGQAASGTPPIGRPVDNTRCYVLDRHQRLVPIGVPGELHIAGDGLARGYLNRPALTAERFIPDPFGERPGGRLYATGDVCRLRASGDLEFLARADRQVKLRGFRIEVGEIEAALNRHPAVQQVVLVVREDVPGDQRLVAYVVCDPDPATAELRSFLHERLPEYMVPASFVQLDRLPLTSHGKVDLAALPLPAEAPPARLALPGAPARGAQEAIAAIWREVLGVSTVGPADNFFERGGHSLLLLRVLERLRHDLGVELRVSDLFQHPTVESLARRIGGGPLETVSDAAAGLRHARRREGPRTDDERVIAVIGMAGRFPKSPDLARFWRNLRDGVECLTPLTREQLLAEGLDPALIDEPQYVKVASILEDAELFDAAFFGISPREAAVTDPQQRLFLEAAWEAIEDAAYDPATYRGRIGVFGGTERNAYLLGDLPIHCETPEYIQMGVGNEPDFLSTRVSYRLNLRGPSFTVQTACSSSMVAIHLACQSLLAGECDMALAGGVTVQFPQRRGYLYYEGLLFSPDGRCRAFDASAKGFCSGQGVGVAVLKRLADAVADGDQIRALIKGTAINNDGALKLGFSAPSVEGQAEAIAAAQAMAGVEPQTISYVEAHGTGTPLGDPTEIAALTRAFRAGTDLRGFCAVGTVKSNIGHPGAAAGVAGLIKTVLSLEHRQLPPSLNFEVPNPEIDFESSPFYVNTRLVDWEAGATPRRAGINSFGVGGTNAHAVLEEAPPPPPAGPSRPWHLLVLSAKSATALDAASARLAEHLERHPELDLADVAYTLQVGRAAFPHRWVTVCRERGEAVAVLRSAAADGNRTAPVAKDERQVVFMFPGQDAGQVGMAAELYRCEPSFRAHVERCLDLLGSRRGSDVRDLLDPPPGDEEAAVQRLERTGIAQPALFVVEYALARLWMEWGVRPEAMIGDGVGELVAACLADVLDLEDGLALAAARGRLTQERRAPGDAASPAAPELVRRPFGEALCGQRLRRPRIRFISDLTGRWITDEQATDPDYWTGHCRPCARFSDGLRTLFAASSPLLLLEVGPGQTLSSLARRHPDAAAGRQVLSSSRGPEEAASDLACLLWALGKAWQAGARIDWPALHRSAGRRRVSLPTYPFERQRYWREPSRWRRERGGDARELPRRSDIADWFYVASWKRSQRPGRSVAAMLAASQRQWLVFCEDGLGDRLARRLQAAGQRVTTVRAGEAFRCLGEGAYAVAPGSADDYDELLRALRDGDRIPSVIAHLWSAADEGAADSGLERLDAEQERGLYSLIGLAGALGRERLTHAIELGVISTGLHDVTGREPLRAERATILGPCRVLPEEQPNITCRSMDIEWPAPGSETEEAAVDEIVAELLGGAADHICAYRGGHRWTRVFEPIRLEPEGAPAARAGRAYLITGGLGRVGLALGEHLAATARAKLILTSRSAFPPRETWERWLREHGEQNALSGTIRRLQAIVALGAEVVVDRADVTSIEQMSAVIDRARVRFGSIGGVIHCAGIADLGGLIHQRPRAAIAQVLAPRVHGAVVLDALLRDEPVDSFIVGSTLSTALPRARAAGVGECAASAFLHAFAENRRRGVRRQAMAWDEEDPGVPRKPDPWRAAVFPFGEPPSPSDGGVGPGERAAVLDRILSSDLPCVLVSPRDLPASIGRVFGRQDSGAVPAHPPGEAPLQPRREPGGSPGAPRSDTERTVAAIWQEVLGIHQVGLEDDFFELGGDSLVAARVLARVRKSFDVRPSLHSMFESPTVAGFASHLEALRQTRADGLSPPTGAACDRDEIEI